jgi:hypothetical protein
MPPVPLPERVREACAWVAGRARWVQIDANAAVAYAKALPPWPPEAERVTPSPGAAEPEAAAAFAICVNAINFGSGWWPTVRKRPGLSDYATMAAGVSECFAGAGPWTPAELRATEQETIAGVLGQDPEHPLMAQFAAALRDVGGHVESDGGGRYLGIVEGRVGARPGGGLRRLGFARRRLQLRRTRGPVLQAGPARGSRPAPQWHRRPQRGRIAHRLRRQTWFPMCCASTASWYSITGWRRGSNAARCSSTDRRRRSSCAPARSTPSSCSPRRQRPPPRRGRCPALEPRPRTPL